MDKGVERPDTTPESDIDSDRLIKDIGHDIGSD